MSSNTANPPGPEVWQAYNLKLVAFPVELAFEASRNWWRELVGSEPETTVEKRQMSERRDTGVINGTDLSLSVNFLRAEWLATPHLTAGQQLEGVPTIGDFLGVSNWFYDLMVRWLANSPPLKRLAFTGSLTQPVDSHAAAYHLLNRYLRCVEVDPLSSDFIYRVNRRRPSVSGISGLSINRLCTWAAGQAVIVQQAFSPEPQGNIQFGRQTYFSCLMEFDINTPPDATDMLVPDRLPDLLREMIEFAVDIAAHGDRPSE